MARRKAKKPSQAAFRALAESGVLNDKAAEAALTKERPSAGRERAQVQAKLDGLREALGRQEQALRERAPELQRGLDTAEASEARAGLWKRLRAGVGKTRSALTEGLASIVAGKKAVDREVLERLEELLLTADLGVETATRLLNRVEQSVRRRELDDVDTLKAALRAEIGRIMSRSYPDPAYLGRHPGVILLLGVNGTGKTTSIGKLAARFSREGQRVLLAAGDTFRAAAAEQLEGWAKRSGCDVVSRAEGSDPSGVAYEAAEKAKTGEYDLLLCDTAGRLHTKHNLMEELKKIKRVIAKVIPDAPHESWLVLDANTGQNAIHQVRQFHEAVGLTGLIVSKLDGTARGGVVVGIVNEFNLPIRYVGIGEGVDDLEPFDPAGFAENLLE
jgi:fused signal recognition particle receptor